MQLNRYLLSPQVIMNVEHKDAALAQGSWKSSWGNLEPNV